MRMLKFDQPLHHSIRLILCNLITTGLLKWQLAGILFYIFFHGMKKAIGT
jgi:hypothetical protein